LGDGIRRLTMRATAFALVAALVLITPIGHPRAAEGPISGFPGNQTEVQRALEARFDEGLDPGDLRSWMQH
jgi:hypothetical protein